jgi:hypothetical protein
LLPASSGLPGTQMVRATPRPLFGLAPGGVCHATPVTRSPVRSYRTVSPLPVLPKEPSAVYSLLHFPSPCDARALPGTLPCGARTFLQRNPREPAGDPYSHAPTAVAPDPGTGHLLVRGDMKGKNRCGTSKGQSDPVPLARAPPLTSRAAKVSMLRHRPEPTAVRVMPVGFGPPGPFNPGRRRTS